MVCKSVDLYVVHICLFICTRFRCSTYLFIYMKQIYLQYIFVYFYVLDLFALHILVSILPVTYQLRAHDDAGKHKFIKPSLNVGKINDLTQRLRVPKQLVSDTQAYLIQLVFKIEILVTKYTSSFLHHSPGRLYIFIWCVI